MNIDSQYCKQSGDEPVVMWSSLNLYDPTSSCFVLQRTSDGSHAVVTKKHFQTFALPRLVSTETEIVEFIKVHKLAQMAHWKSDALEAVSLTPGKIRTPLSSPLPTVVA